MAKRNKEKNQTNVKEKHEEKKVGYGNKKIEGPDRPST